MNWNRRMGGYKAKGIGDAFENLFNSTCHKFFIIPVRIPNGGRVYKDRTGKMGVKLVKSPYDWLITRGGRSAVLDTKTIESGNFTYSCIDQDQLRNLNETAISIPSGYVVWYRQHDTVYFYAASVLRALKPKESLKLKDGLLLGTIGNFNPEKIFDWKDDDQKLLFQQRIF